MKTKILIVEDDASVRRMVARVLELAGYTTIQAATWREAQMLFEAAQPALLLLDLEVAREEGWENLGARTAGTPVIGLTAWPNELSTVVRWGLDALMEKPLEPSALLQTIQALLAQGAPEPKPQPQPEQLWAPAASPNHK